MRHLRARRILVVNPVGTTEWDESDVTYLRSQARAGTTVDIVSLEHGPVSLEGACYESEAIPGILQRVREGAAEHDGILINCFLDPGVAAAREAVDIPVAGPGESGMILASMLGHTFAILAVAKNLIPRHREQARVLGLGSRLASVLSLDIPVVALLEEPRRTIEAALAQARLARDRDGAEVIVLGCTGMATLAERIRENLDMPVVEPAAAALKMLETWIDLRLTHSRAGLYRRPDFAAILWPHGNEAPGEVSP